MRCYRISRRVAPLLLSCALFFGCSHPKPLKLEWTEYKAPDGSFSILFPGVPVPKQEKLSAPGGGREIQSFRVTTGPALFEVLVETFPESLVLEQGPALLQGAAEGNRRSGKTIVNKSPTAVEGHDAIDYVAEDKFGNPVVKTYQGRLIQVGDRIFDVAIEAPPKTISPDDVKKYLDSFKLIEH